MDTLARLKAGQLAGATRLDLSCGLTDFPREIFELADTLEILNLTGNQLTQLPDDLGRLTQLRVLFCSNNLFTEVPASVGQCPRLSMVGFKSNRIERLPAAALPPLLRWLILTDNRLQQLPDALGDCLHMQKLMLAGNRLTSLPDSLARLHNLELLRLSANCLEQLPPWLYHLPRLAWLAYAGNPLGEAFAAPQQAGHAEAIAWSELSLQQRLGEGASGIIQQALWQPRQQPVAVKLYKGSMTSDGSPLNEMIASVAVGEHPNLIKVEGRLCDHPDGTAGLVMQLIDPSFLNLAGPPSFDSCTRDVYPDALAFTPEVLLRMARGAASVAAQLHERGINHGDLYAHNILWRADGHCLLGDFGAAAFYPRDDGPTAQGLERIEVRAFGLLLEEWLQRCEQVPEGLWQLQRECVQPEVSERPAFTDIVARLAEQP